MEIALEENGEPFIVSIKKLSAHQVCIEFKHGFQMKPSFKLVLSAAHAKHLENALHIINQLMLKQQR